MLCIRERSHQWLASAIIGLCLCMTAFPQPSAFTYQGKLADGASAASGTYHMQFSLYNAVSGGTQIGSTITNTSVVVTDGVFTVQLDFSPAAPFAAGADRWLEVAVKKPQDAAFTTLVPRQPITSSPYSLRTISASFADSLSPACVGCVAIGQGGTGASTAAAARTNLGVAATSGGLGQFASTTSAELAALISGETGSGGLVFNTSPTFLGSPIFSGGNAGMFSFQSLLTTGDRVAPAILVTQPNNATNDSIAPLVSIAQGDTASAGDSLRVSQAGAGEAVSVTATGTGHGVVSTVASPTTQFGFMTNGGLDVGGSSFLGDAATDTVNMNGTSIFGAPATFNNTVTANDTLTANAKMVLDPGPVQIINAVSDSILANAAHIVLNPDGNSYTLTSTPTIADGTNGQLIYIRKHELVNGSVTLQDVTTLSGSNLNLAAPSRTLGTDDVLVLLFNGFYWVEVSYANN